MRKREKKPILPPSPRDGPSRKAGDHKGPERGRRDSFKKKDEDDGEMDEGEIDVSEPLPHHLLCLIQSAP